VKFNIGAILISVCLALPVAGQPAGYLYTNYWAYLYDYELEGDYIYCSFWKGLMIVDVLDPSVPSITGQLFRPRQSVAIAISHSNAYMANYGLEIINIYNPNEPVFVARWEGDPTSKDVAVNGDYAYLLSDYGLSIIDVSNPSNPVFTGYKSVEGIRMAVSGEYAFVTSDTCLYIINVSDPANPFSACIFPMAYPGEIYVSDGYAYVSDDSSCLNIINISDPENPWLAGRATEEFGVTRIRVQGDYAFITDFFYGLRIFDISNPQIPIFIYLYDNPGMNKNLCVKDSLVYLGDRISIQLININDVNNPMLTGRFNFGCHVAGLFLYDNNLYISDTESGLHILDVSLPSEPTVVIDYITPGHAWNSYVRGDYAFVAARSSGMHIVDISDPANPNIISSFIDLQDAAYVEIEGDYAYIGAYRSEMYVANISDLTNPTIAGYIDTGFDYLYEFTKRDQYIYMGSLSLKIIDISDPGNPTMVSTYAENQQIRGISILGNYAYLTNVTTGNLELIDISDPLNPYLINEFAMPDLPYFILVENNYAYIAAFGETLYIYDVSDTFNPVRISHFNPINIQDMVVDGNYIYSASMLYFIILYFDPTTGTIEQVSRFPAEFLLPQNYPNPFNASTTISYSLPQAADIRIEIYDILGRRVETLFSGPQRAGEHMVNWKPGDISSGVYYYRIGSDVFNKSKSCLLIR